MNVVTWPGNKTETIPPPHTIAAERERSSAEITHEAMRAYFVPRLAAELPPGVSLAQVLRAERSIDEGRFRTHEELRARLAGA
jgi:predicted transcriptional regulator